MSSKAHQTQHRPPRETARGKELAQAKQTVKQLQRLVARLQRRLEKYESREPLEESPESLAVSESEAQGLDRNSFRGPVTGSEASAPDPNACPCGYEEFTEVCTPSGKKIRICKGCKSRKSVPL